MGRTVTAATFSNGRSGVLIRCAATFNGTTWSATTPLHAVEHFGATLRAPAGIQRFNWLGEDPANPGTLIRKFGTSTSGGAPTIPILVPAPVVVDNGNGPVVQQEMHNSELEPGEVILPDAVWVQRFVSSMDDEEHAPTCDELGGANDCTNFIGPRIATMMSAAIVELPGA